MMSEEDKKLLKLTQDIRVEFINELKQHGVPDNKDDKVLIAKLLDGLDKAILAKTKLSIDDKANKNSEETNALIANILTKHTVKSTGVRTTSIELPSEIEYTDPVEGEMEQGISTLTYDEFMSDKK